MYTFCDTLRHSTACACVCAVSVQYHTADIIWLPASCSQFSLSLLLPQHYTSPPSFPLTLWVFLPPFPHFCITVFFSKIVTSFFVLLVGFEQVNLIYLLWGQHYHDRHWQQNNMLSDVEFPAAWLLFFCSLTLTIILVLLLYYSAIIRSFAWWCIFLKLDSIFWIPQTPNPRQKFRNITGKCFPLYFIIQIRRLQWT